MIEGGDRLRMLRTGEEALLLPPALLHRVQAPLDGIALADGFSADLDEDRIGVRARKDAQGVPTAALHRMGELQGPKRSIGLDLHPGDGHAVLDQFDRHLAAGTDAGPLDVPVGLLAEPAPLDLGLRLLLEPGRGLDTEDHRAPRRKLQKTPLLSQGHRIGLEVHEVTASVADIIASGPDALAPVLIRPALGQLHIAAPQSDPLAVDARKVGLTADARAIAGVEGVVPDVQLPRIRRVDSADEIHRGHRLAIGAGYLMRHVGSDPAERRDLAGGQLGRVELEAPTTVGRAGEGPLGLGPLEGVQPQGGPMLLGVAPRIHLLP